MDIPIQKPSQRKVHKYTVTTTVDNELYELAKEFNISFTEGLTIGLKILLERVGAIEFSDYVTRARFQALVQQLQEATAKKAKVNEKEAMELLDEISKEVKDGDKDEGN
jgi:hypothetical protein